MDYAPERGALPAGVDLVHGVIKAHHAGRTNTVGEAIVRRLYPHGPTADRCYYSELLMPPAAPDVLADPLPLVTRYQDQLLPDQADLLTITTFRFDHVLAAHAQWEIARAFVRDQIVVKRSLPVMLAHHLPGLAGRAAKPHIHALACARALHGSTFGSFSDLTKPGAKALLAEGWARHLGGVA